MSKFCKAMGLYVTYLDCMECEDKECMKKEKKMNKAYLAVEVGSEVFLVFTAKRSGGKDNVVIKCRVNKAVVYEHSIVYCCEPVKIVTKCKENLDKFVTLFMFENANIDTGHKGNFNRYPVFTTKEKCLEWLRG